MKNQSGGKDGLVAEEQPSRQRCRVMKLALSG